MKSHIKYPKIRQFQDILRNVKHRTDFRGLDDDGNAVYVHDRPYPTLHYIGTVKLHGTNAAIIVDNDGSFQLQSRSRILDVAHDNAGFAAFVAGLDDSVRAVLSKLRNRGIYGEWCGGNIQASVALNELEKMFVIFSVRDVEDIENKTWTVANAITEEDTKLLNGARIFFIDQFQTFEIDIDFDSPKLSVPELERITKEVGDQCPVAAHFGARGIGEGVVWKCVDEGYETSDLWFKVKDERHSSSRVKKIVSVDIEKLNTIQEFVDFACTQNRMQQGIDVLKERGVEITRAITGDYLRWLVNDCVDEEAAVLGKAGLCTRDVSKTISEKGRVFLFDYIAHDL